ncbi:MAG: guanylate kinase [Candidatus Kapabacteria bacterium]|nr:guanylate kinase [Candidatus Kapabacteria bacterium]
MRPRRLIVLSAPSGAGKTTVARYLLQTIPDAVFSVSATTRPRRNGEVDGRDYHFLSREEFEQKIASGELVEYEEIFGNYYGTLRQPTVQALQEGKVMIFDVDVRGALSLKRTFPEDTFLLFISPPSLEELERRLRHRGTESEEQIQRRLARAALELSYQNQFDAVIVNDDLARTLEQARTLVEQVLRGEERVAAQNNQ